MYASIALHLFQIFFRDRASLCRHPTMMQHSIACTGSAQQHRAGAKATCAELAWPAGSTAHISIYSFSRPLS